MCAFSQTGDFVHARTDESTNEKRIAKKKGIVFFFNRARARFRRRRRGGRNANA